MTDQEWMREGIDLKLYLLLLRKKLWVVIVFMVIGATMSGGYYAVTHILWQSGREYQAVSKYYIAFANDKAKDYYNAYTWNEYVGTDAILNKTMEQLPAEYDREQVKASVKAAIESDVRLLTTTVTTNQPEQTLAIAQATENSLVAFAKELPEFREIRLMQEADVEQVISGEYLIRAAFLGGMGGLLLAVFLLVFQLLLDSSIYLPKEFERRYHYPLFGVVPSLDQYKELCCNLEYMCGEPYLFGLMPVRVENKNEIERICEQITPISTEEEHVQLVPLDSCLNNSDCYEKMRDVPNIILAVKYGDNNGAMIDRTIKQLQKQNCNLVGAILYGVDQKLYKRYEGNYKKFSKDMT